MENNHEQRNQKMNLPPQEVLQAFNLKGVPILLNGGQGTSYLVANVVLKPTDDVIEAGWLATINNSLKSDKFRVPKPIQASDGNWVFNGWTANSFLKGKHIPGNYSGVIQASKDFHKVLANIPKPEFFDERNDVWAVADRIAWGELPIPDFKLTNEPLRKIFKFIRKNELPNQLIHGDMGTGNVLFDEKLAPAVIDLSLYYRPADFAIAVMMIDALVYEGADKSILKLGKDLKDFDQLLLRALARRICEYIGHQTHNEAIKDFSPEIIKHLNIMDIVIGS
ncbi:MAG: phosphotransferase [Candidatus Parcubacteria bacterium]|nr:phosphotransferase [Candidatus Parcubacteria bacterium]